ncbi:NnrS family protein [Rhizobium sp. SEMIA 4085]|uniref:NnrS family protein n=1 Tax=Rhizobium gallicum bv. gallicum R602sp TaxID=1041138 RepID=A0A0B4XDR7_9HYPH|nr:MULTISPECIES: NnrS family protein [Rhizobium]AJD46129.1 NnrS family protein [Rhizobium gallicum bv. gallicum R602sp]NNH29170.1 NnrS family protein [Rhizobium sp. SEMIA 4085]
MQNTSAAEPATRIPRGMWTSGSVLFSYGFRPFFLGAAVWSILCIGLWAAFLSLGRAIALDYGPTNWHAHEMLFGFASAVLAGFLLTAVPNWTGRLPVSGRPLVVLFGLWTFGRAAVLVSDTIGVLSAAVIDSLFLPAMLIICAREVIAGRKWKDLKVIGGLAALSAANICFHILAIEGVRPELPIRLALGAYVALITIVGGRILPSFTRNWLNQFGRTDFPVPYNHFDATVIIVGVVALACWTIAPTSVATGGLSALAAVLNLIRLYRWRGWTTRREPILSVLHVAYLFIPLGFGTIAFGSIGLDQTSILHTLAIGVVALMMLAVMTRATRGHTGRKLKASALTTASYVVLAIVAVVRPAAELVPAYTYEILMIAALGWIVAFGLFLAEHAPFLCRTTKSLR